MKHPEFCNNGIRDSFLLKKLKSITIYTFAEEAEDYISYESAMIHTVVKLKRCES